jgi:hypothetical protein
MMDTVHLVARRGVSSYDGRCNLRAVMCIRVKDGSALRIRQVAVWCSREFCTHALDLSVHQWAAKVMFPEF